MLVRDDSECYEMVLCWQVMVVSGGDYYILDGDRRAIV